MLDVCFMYLTQLFIFRMFSVSLLILLKSYFSIIMHVVLVE